MISTLNVKHLQYSFFSQINIRYRVGRLWGSNCRIQIFSPCIHIKHELLEKRTSLRIRSKVGPTRVSRTDPFEWPEYPIRPSHLSERAHVRSPHTEKIGMYGLSTAVAALQRKYAMAPPTVGKSDAAREH